MEAGAMQKPMQLKTNDLIDEDLVLVEASTNGDIAAFERLVAKYDRKLLGIALRITGNPEDGQEAVQEALLKAYQKLRQFQGNSKFSTWLIRITMNECLMKLRKRKRVARELPLGEGDGGLAEPLDLADWSPNPEQLYSRSELQEILRKELAGLRPGLRMVFVLRDIEGLSIAETAIALGLGESAVKARLLRARLGLRDALSKYFKQPTSASTL